MKLLVTGGLGYLGGRFAELVGDASRHDVVLGTRRPDARPPRGVDAATAVIDNDDLETFSRACRGVDVVVQLAGMNAGSCRADPAGALRSRREATRLLLRAATDAGVQRVIHVSSAHVYGQALTGPVDELTPVRPIHPYAHSHLAAEAALLEADAPGERYVARLSNAYGLPLAGGEEGWNLFTNAMCRQAIRNRELSIESDSSQLRDFIPVSEACRALLHLCELPAERLPDAVYNIGSGRAVSLRDQAGIVARQVQRSMGFEPEIRCVQSPGSPAATLEYRVSRLLATGFVPDPDAEQAELVRMLDACARGSAP